MCGHAWPGNAFYKSISYDETVKSQESVFPVILVKVGIQYFQSVLDAGVRRHDAFSTFYRFINYESAQEGLDMHKLPGIITLMGSGELTTTMVEVHKELLEPYGDGAQAVFLDTPAGFQLNADDISKKAIDYFQNRVLRPLTVASLKSAEAGREGTVEEAYRRVREADYVLVGPGSPTYALRQWQQTHIPELLVQRISKGGTFVAASAAALLLGKS